MNRGVRVASVPADHPYVRHLAPVDDETPSRFVRLPDPDPARPERPASGVWWPPAMLEPSWVASHVFDLMHVHFGIDARTPDQLRALVAELRRTARPLVLTLHDLRSPHQVDRTVLDTQLDVLVPAADALLTLTASAADEVERRWGRRPLVVAHPHLVDLATMARVRRSRARTRPAGPPRVGVAVKDLRANSDPERLLAPLLRVPGVRLVVSAHRRLVERPDRPEAVRLVRALTSAARSGVLDLMVHDPLPDCELWDLVAGLDVAVLPYRFGTHSGWLEMAHDLGTSVVAPTSGHYAGQGVEGVYRADEHSLDEDSVVTAVLDALGRRSRHGLPGLDCEQRTAQRATIVDTHRHVYDQVLTAPGRRVA